MDFAITGKKINPSEQYKLPSQKLIKTKPKSTVTPVIRTPSKKPSVPQYSGKKVEKPAEKKKQQKFQKVQQKVQQVPKQKVSEKLQMPPLLNQKQEQIKQEPKQQQIKNQPKIYDILVRYNHYKDKFPAQNNLLKYEVIQDKYTFALVFKGNYLPELRKYRKQIVQPQTEGNALQYTWKVQQGQQYQIFIKQDEQEESKYERKIYLAPKQDKCPFKKNVRAQQLTNEMKKMSIQQLGSQKHKQLLEQRALEQQIYS